MHWSIFDWLEEHSWKFEKRILPLRLQDINRIEILENLLERYILNLTPQPCSVYTLRQKHGFLVEIVNLLPRSC